LRRGSAKQSKITRQRRGTVEGRCVGLVILQEGPYTSRLGAEVQFRETMQLCKLQKTKLVTQKKGEKKGRQ